jgi:cytochrome b6-f complex iron-sulfur subunit
MAFFTDFFKAILGICETRPLDAALWTREGNEVTVKLAEATALSPVGGAVRLQGKGLGSPVLIVHANADDYLAFENRCTHVGRRRLDPVAGKQELRCCSIGHSRFDYEGSRLSGPAKDPLKKYPVEKRDEELIVTLDGGSEPGPD